MEQFNDSVLFTLHILLLGAKIWLLWAVIKNIRMLHYKDSPTCILFLNPAHMVILGIALFIACFELWFLANFYNDVVLELYEQFSIVDQILLTGLIAQFLKGGLNGWK